VPDYRVLTESEIVDFLKSDEFDSNQTVVLEKDPQVPHPGEKLPMIEAHILLYSANKIICTTETSYSGFLVLADNWHPDWKVFVDGEQSELYRANHTFRAVHLLPGEHEIVFAYISPYFNIGKIISIITLILSISFCVIVLKPTHALEKAKNFSII
ncbi:MAG: YfhO family protein, partial [candidate division WOR-3 bacterium]